MPAERCIGPGSCLGHAGIGGPLLSSRPLPIWDGTLISQSPCDTMVAGWGSGWHCNARVPGSDMPYPAQALGKVSKPAQPCLKDPASCLSWPPSGSLCPSLPDRDGPPSLQLFILGLNATPSSNLASLVHSGSDLGGQRGSPGWQLMEPGQNPLRGLSRRISKTLEDPGVW